MTQDIVAQHNVGAFRCALGRFFTSVQIFVSISRLTKPTAYNKYINIHKYTYTCKKNKTRKSKTNIFQKTDFKMISVLWRFVWPAFCGPKILVYIYIYIYIFIFIYIRLPVVLRLDCSCLRLSRVRPFLGSIDSWLKSDMLEVLRTSLQLISPSEPKM